MANPPRMLEGYRVLDFTQICCRPDLFPLDGGNGCGSSKAGARAWRRSCARLGFEAAYC